MFRISETYTVSWLISDHGSVNGLAAELSTVKANLTQCLQASLNSTEVRDQLNARLAETTKELNRLQNLSQQSECSHVLFGFYVQYAPCIVVFTVSRFWILNPKTMFKICDSIVLEWMSICQTTMCYCGHLF